MIRISKQFSEPRRTPNTPTDAQPRRTPTKPSKQREPWQRKFYNSTSWRKLRASYIKQREAVDGGLCEECHEALGYIVHHKKHLTKANHDDFMVALNINNLSYVCKACHDQYDGHGIKNKLETPPCQFDSDGNPLPIPDDTPHWKYQKIDIS